jgi:hypothetical protein
MSISSAEYDEYVARRKQIEKAIKHLEELNIKYCKSKEQYQKDLLMHYRSCPRIE